MITAIVVAAGNGSRMNMPVKKQFIHIAGQPVLTRALLSIKSHADAIIIVVQAGEEDLCLAAAKAAGVTCKVVTGGETRQQSVFNGLCQTKTDFVLIHDGVRPFANHALVQRVIESAIQHGAAIPAVPVSDTIKFVTQGWVQSTPQRGQLRAIQTPQAFRTELLWNAHCHAREHSIEATDDAGLVEALGEPVSVVSGNADNFKITTQADLLHARQMGGEYGLRVGTGYDVHRFAKERALILGGITIPYHLGLEGHSDADVVVHALMDAMLGAAAMGDIGLHFPDTDSRWAGADSCDMLAHVLALIANKGYKIGNVDAVIIAQEPKLNPYFCRMQDKLSQVLVVSVDNINIKATTSEGLGFTGRGEGIAAHCVCTLVPSRRNISEG